MSLTVSVPGEDLPITISMSCVFIISRPWRLPGHLLWNLLPVVYDYFSLKPSLCVWGFHRILHPKQLFPSKAEKLSYSKLSMLLYLKTVMPSRFWKSSLTKELPFFRSMLFAFSRKIFEHLVKFYYLKNIIFRIAKSFSSTNESSKDPLFIAQLFQGTKPHNSQEWWNKNRAQNKQTREKEPTQGKTARSGNEVRPTHTVNVSFSRPRTKDSSKSSVVLLNHGGHLCHYMLFTSTIT